MKKKKLPKDLIINPADLFKKQDKKTQKATEVIITKNGEKIITTQRKLGYDC